MQGRTRCRRHGGKTPQGPASPNWRRGRYSKWLPTGLRDKVEALVQDPEVLSLIPNVQLVDAQIAELLEGLDAVQAPAWAEAVLAAEGVEDARRTMADDNGAALVAALTKLIQIVRRGGSRQATFKRLNGLMLQRSLIVAREVRRQVAEKESLSMDRVVGLMQRLVEIVFLHVVDQAMRQKVITDMERLMLTAPAEDEPV